MSPFMFLAVCFVWANLAFQVWIAVEFGATPLRLVLVVMGVACAVVTTFSAGRVTKK